MLFFFMKLGLARGNDLKSHHPYADVYMTHMNCIYTSSHKGVLNGG